jgi:hypothetical protein
VGGAGPQAAAYAPEIEPGALLAPGQGMQRMTVALLCLGLACAREPVPGRRADCPHSLPAEGSRCDPGPYTLFCEYDGGAHGGCATSAACGVTVSETIPTWSVRGPVTSCEGNPATCPATFAEAAGGARCLPPGDSTCDYGEGRCSCLTCGDNAGPKGSAWGCVRWDQPTSLYPGVWRREPDPRCPPARPLAGDLCESV